MRFWHKIHPVHSVISSLVQSYNSVSGERSVLIDFSKIFYSKSFSRYWGGGGEETWDQYFLGTQYLFFLCWPAQVSFNLPLTFGIKKKTTVSSFTQWEMVLSFASPTFKCLQKANLWNIGTRKLSHFPTMVSLECEQIVGFKIVYL